MHSDSRSEQVGPRPVLEAERIGDPFQLTERNMAKPSPEPCPKSESLPPVKDPGRYGFHFRLSRQQRTNLRSGINESDVVLPRRIIVKEKFHIVGL